MTKELTVAAVFLNEASAIGTLLVSGIRLVCAYNNLIKHTIALLVVIVLAGKYRTLNTSVRSFITVHNCHLLEFWLYA